MSVEFNFSAPAELFAATGRGNIRRHMTYHRFPTGAEAIKYAVETLPPEMLSGSVLEVDEERFEADDIRRLYDSAAYPLVRVKLA